MNVEEPEEWRDIKMEAEQEFRFEVNQKKIKLKVKEGFAEIFGTELALDVPYLFHNTKLSVFTWKGCILSMFGECEVDYIAGDTPMYTYLNTHLALEGLRERARFEKKNGPRVLILGGSDVGKTTLSRILLNYGVKMEKKMMFIDLDVNEGSVSLPGVLSASSIQNPIDPEEGFGSTPLTTNISPLCYYYGYLDCLEKSTAYGVLMKKLSEVVEKKTSIDEETRYAGYIINTPSQFSENTGYDLLFQAVEDFKVDALLIIGHERLYSDMKKKYNDFKEIHVVKIDKSGGVVQRDKKFRKQLQMDRIKEYFYGSPTENNRAELNPYRNIIRFSDVNIRRIGDSAQAPTSALPLGIDRKSRETKMLKVIPGDILLHSVLGITHLEKNAEQTLTNEEESQLILSSNLLGFFYVSEVDEAKQIITVLSPNPLKLRNKYFLMGSLKWVETS
ncbi:hypothetical protein HK099_006912 [Clydaea vesicula]|uniref:Polynucleotide 5'-hydroxyl-kinase GRC3 n=1 Tax=Clydaea vesicula TaxID=447962 RepID=A0AAD5U7E1_9FUNG|nr:hypothetical protein HK099_006912 [Clydaea vesicula]KAJ3396848.1 hypothetical protein HDU92_001682 [Lobulomyces angularis]